MHTKAKTGLMTIWLILAFILLCSISITMIFAENNSQNISVGINYKTNVNAEEILKNFTLSLDTETGTYSITSISDDIEGEVIIPNEYNGIPITKISLPNAFIDCKKVTKIVIQENLIDLSNGKYGTTGLKLRYCISLESIVVKEGNPRYHSNGNCLIETETGELLSGCKNSVIPTDGSVTSIASEAFFGCYELTSINIPNSVIDIGECVFTHCKNLKIITVDEENPIYYSDKNCIIERSSKKLIIGCSVSGCPSGVTCIGKFAFMGSNIDYAYFIASTVTTIEEFAFAYCKNLNLLLCENSINLTTIERAAFSGCTNLTTISVSDGTYNETKWELYNSEGEYVKTINSGTSSEFASLITSYSGYKWVRTYRET